MVLLCSCTCPCCNRFRNHGQIGTKFDVDIVLPEVTSFMCFLYWIKSLRSLISLTMILFQFVSIPFLCWCLPALLWGTSTSFLKILLLIFIHSYSSLNTAQIFQTHYLEFVSVAVDDYWLKMSFIDYFTLLWCLSVPFYSVYNFTECRTTLWIFCLYIHQCFLLNLFHFQNKWILPPSVTAVHCYCCHCLLVNVKHSVIYLLIYIVTYSLTYLITYLLSYLVIYLLIYLLTYLLTYSHTHSLARSLTPWSRVLLKKLTGSQVIKKFPAFYGTRRFITTFTRPHLLSFSWARSIQSMPPIPLPGDPC